MKKFTANQLREMWFKFYEDKGHRIIGSASLIPENDPSVLFTTAGMHPLVPYLLGEKHPMGSRLADIQKCLRTDDIMEVGDMFHHTFFEMLGNWSLGDYFKKEKTQWTFEFLTSKEYLGLGIDQIAVTCFAGDNTAPRDEETAKLWEDLGVPKDRIFFLPKKDNWWEINRGPCGPDNEVFLDTGKPKCSPNCNPSCHCGKYIELGNDVYMQYNKIGDNEYIPAKQKNVDTGFGLERNLAVLNGSNDNYTTELFSGAIEEIERLSGKTYVREQGDEYTKSFRIVADHIRSATAIIGDRNGLVPSNVGAGYILRRLIRRAVMNARNLGIEQGNLSKIAKVYIEYFKDIYPEFKEREGLIVSEIDKEENKFFNTISAGMKEFNKVVDGIRRKNEFMKGKEGFVEDKTISGKAAFRLYDTFGFPIEITLELAEEQGLDVDMKGFNEAYEQHQELARTASAGQFKGGLADGGVQTTRLHTATHLLNAALRNIVSPDVRQKGSNITSERLRFDFNCDHKLTQEELTKLEQFVNKAIEDEIPVTCEEMTVDEAKNSGAIGVFDSKYGDKVKVYTIGDVSKEICGGPHANNTSELHHFKIVKEEASSAGIRRIKAVLD